MTDPSDRLADYPALAPHEREEVDAYVAAHPEHAAALADAQRLAAALDRARSEAHTIDRAEALAGQALGQPLSPERTANRNDDAETQALRDRIDALAAGMEDPTAQFERLTGRSLEASAAPSSDSSARRAPDRPAEATVRPGRLRLAWMRPLAYAALALIVAYGGLFAYSTTTVSDRDRLADLGTLADYKPLRLRGGEADDLETRLDVVLDGVDDARRSTLGLFPHYDEAALDRVATNLSDIVIASPPGSSVHEEAQFAIGRIRFTQGRTADARAALAPLVDSGGPYAPDARRLLDALDATE